MKTFDVRVVDDDLPLNDLMAAFNTCGATVYAAAQLVNDGFANITPDRTTLRLIGGGHDGGPTDVEAVRLVLGTAP